VGDAWAMPQAVHPPETEGISRDLLELGRSGGTAVAEFINMAPPALYQGGAENRNGWMGHSHG